MSGTNQLPEWEANTERRLGIVEQKIDKMLDPIDGIWPSILSAEHRLQRWAVGIMVALMFNLLGVIGVLLLAAQ